MLDAGSKILILIVIVIVIFQFLIPEIEMADKNVRPPFSPFLILNRAYALDLEGFNSMFPRLSAYPFTPSGKKFPAQ